MSGSLVLRSGVGTQMLMVSSSRDYGEIGGRVEAAGSHKLGDFAAGDVLHMRLAAIQAVDSDCCRSMPVTWKPALANSTASGRPT